MPEYRVSWKHESRQEIVVAGDSLRDVLGRARAGEFFEDAYTVSETDISFQAEEIQP